MHLDFGAKKPTYELYMYASKAEIMIAYRSNLVEFMIAYRSNLVEFYERLNALLFE
jgi:hypothetical protein